MALFYFAQKTLVVEPGFEPGVQFPVRQFSKLVVSATHPSHRLCGRLRAYPNEVQMYALKPYFKSLFILFFKYFNGGSFLREIGVD